MGDLTEHFNSIEFACRGRNCCGGLAIVAPILIDYAERLRCRLDVPLRINSGFRCLTHNRAVHGSPKSNHCRGTAIDIQVPVGITMQALYEAALIPLSSAPFRFILYPTRHFIHVDLEVFERSFGYIDLKPVTLDCATHHEAFFKPYAKAPNT